MSFSWILADEPVILSLQGGWKIFQSGSLTCLAKRCLLLVGGLSFLHVGLFTGLCEFPCHDMVAGLPQSQPSKRSRWELQCLLWPSFRSKNRMTGQKKTCFLFRFVLFFSSLKTVFDWDWGSEHDGIIFHDLKINYEKVEITSCCGNCWRGADRNRGLCVPVRTYGPQLDDGQPVWVYPGPKQVLARWGPKRWFLQRQHHKLEVDAVTGNDGGGVASPMTLRGGGGAEASGSTRQRADLTCCRVGTSSDKQVCEHAEEDFGGV